MGTKYKKFTKRIKKKRDKHQSMVFRKIADMTEKFLWHHPPEIEALVSWWEKNREEFLLRKSLYDFYGRGYNTVGRKEIRDLEASEDPVDATWWTLSYFSDRWCPSRVGRMDRIVDWWRERLTSK